MDEEMKGGREEGRQSGEGGSIPHSCGLWVRLTG